MRATHDVVVTYLVSRICAGHRHATNNADEEATKIKIDYQALLVEKTAIDTHVSELNTDLDSKLSEFEVNGLGESLAEERV